MVPAIRKQLSGILIALAVQNHTESAQSLLQRNIASRHTGKLLCHREALGQETLNLTGTVYCQLILLGQLVHTHDGDDILQLLITLQHLLYRTGYLVVLVAYDLRRKDPAGGIQRVYGRIDTLGTGSHGKVPW